MCDGGGLGRLPIMQLKDRTLPYVKNGTLVKPLGLGAAIELPLDVFQQMMLETEKIRGEEEKLDFVIEAIRHYQSLKNAFEQMARIERGEEKPRSMEDFLNELREEV